MTGLIPSAGHREARGHGPRQAAGIPGAQAVYLRSSIPAIVIAVLCVVGAAVVLVLGGSGALRAAVIAITCCVVVMLVVAILAANAVGRQLAGQLTALRMQVMRGQEDLERMTDQAMRGEQPVPPAAVPPPGRAASGDPFRLLAYDLGQVQQTAGQAILMVAERTHGRSDQRVEIFVNLARRMQSLVHREIEMLDALEAQVEDPDLLKGLFTVDHLATRMRRQSESLAVLGGSGSRRQWTRQVTMHEVLRAAVAEVEQYSRVKIVPPVEGMVRGAAVADVIHLIAELVENATKFSAPRTQALLRAQQVTSGVAIEIEDRGLGMLAADQQRMNALLAEPGRIDLDELLRDGRIGLYVVSTLARRHDVRVQLQGNIYGGTSAVVVLPTALLQDGGERQLPRSTAGSRDSGPLRGGVSGESVMGGADSDAERELVTAGQYIPGSAASATSARPPAAGSPFGTGSSPGASFGTNSSAAGDYLFGGSSASTSSSSASSDNGFSGSGFPAATAAAEANAVTGPIPAAPTVPGYPSPQPAVPPERPPLPTRPVSSASAFTASSSPGEPSSDERPALPRRQAQTSLAAQLRDGSGGTGPSPARSSDPLQDHTPGLMADFLRGVSRSEDQDQGPDADGTTR
jgi:histidine kinase/DNA gyrase B/HSP90-like ATPase